MAGILSSLLSLHINEHGDVIAGRARQLDVRRDALRAHSRDATEMVSASERASERLTAGRQDSDAPLDGH